MVKTDSVTRRRVDGEFWDEEFGSSSVLWSERAHNSCGLIELRGGGFWDDMLCVADSADGRPDAEGALR